MREHEYRGKRIDNGYLVYGSLIICGMSGKTYIFETGDSANESEKVGMEGCLSIFTFEVIPETVGEYTGLKDSTGRKIYEGDIIRYETEFAYDLAEESIKEEDPLEDRIEHEWATAAVKWCGENNYPAFDIEPNKANEESNGLAWMMCSDENWHIEVIGNIHDNPELVVRG